MNSRQLLSRARLRRACCWGLRRRPAPKAPSIFPPARISIQEKLAKVSEFFKNEVATGKIAGAIVLIQQHGKPVYHESFGVQDVVSKAPITDKTIFRLFSMTKAITSVVAMMLIEDGKFKLDDPVSKYIPSFANVKVGVEKKAEDGTKTLELVPLNRPDHHSRPDASHLRHHLWLLWRQSGPQGLRGRQYLCGRFRPRRVRRADRQTAAAQPAGRALAIRPFHRHAGADHGDRVRKIAARDREGKAARSARHERHRLLRHRSGEAAS